MGNTYYLNYPVNGNMLQQLEPTKTDGEDSKRVMTQSHMRKGRTSLITFLLFGPITPWGGAICSQQLCRALQSDLEAELLRGIPKFFLFFPKNKFLLPHWPRSKSPSLRCDNARTLCSPVLRSVTVAAQISESGGRGSSRWSGSGGFPGCGHTRRHL